MVCGDGVPVSGASALFEGGEGYREMDRRSWLWRRKSSEKSPGETESSGSVSSHSEKYSDDQEVSKASPIHSRSPEVSSNVASCEDSNTIKSLTQKLSTALLNIRAKEELVKQHAKVAEEAVSGWEKAEKEVTSLGQKLESATQKNFILEERISQLDGALKECVRQIRQSREEEEWKIQNTLVEKTHEWESEKFELQKRLIELEAQLEAAENEPASVSQELQFKLGKVEKENSILKSELLAQSEELNIRTLERDLSNHAAETASKQHLQSTKKVTKLEAECRRLQAVVRKSSLNSHKSYINLASVESHSDGLSESGERSLELDNELSCSDAWASALIAELDHFKTGKTIGQISAANSVEIDLMDDFLKMEKLVASPETNCGSRSIEPQVDHFAADSRNSTLEAELKKTLLATMSELEKNNGTIETERAEMERLLAESQDHLKGTHTQLQEAETKLVDLQSQLQFANDSKQAVEIAHATAEVQRKLLELQLESADLNKQELHEKVGVLEGKVEEERLLSAQLARKCHDLENDLLKNKREAELRRAAISNGEMKIKQEKGLAVAAGKLAECQKTIASLGQQLRSLATLDDDSTGEGGQQELNEGSPVSKIQKRGDAPSGLLGIKEPYRPPLPSSSPSSASSFQDVQHNLSLRVGAV